MTEDWEGGSLEDSGKLDNPEYRCRHGKFIGDPFGPDYMCMACELGLDDDDEPAGYDSSRHYNQEDFAEGAGELYFKYHTCPDCGEDKWWIIIHDLSDTQMMIECYNCHHHERVSNELSFTSIYKQPADKEQDGRPTPY